jgi:hypothetical protein
LYWKTKGKARICVWWAEKRRYGKGRMERYDIMPLHMTTDINDALLGIYKKYWPGLQETLGERDAVAEKICYPWLIYSFPGYQQARIKVFIVGQEPGGWGFSNKAVI